MVTVTWWIFIEMFYMCHFEILFHDDDLGFVVHCNECNKIQVTFGNAALTLGLEEFDSFRSWIKQIASEQDPANKNGSRNLFIPTPCESVSLVMSKRELDEFVVMLETADNELKSLGLLKLFTAG